MKKLTFLFTLLCATMFAPAVAQTYEKVLAAPIDWSGTYLIVYENSATEAYVHPGADEANGYIMAPIAENKIVNPTNAVEFEIVSMDGGYSLSPLSGANAGKYMVAKSTSGNGTNFVTTQTSNTLTFISETEGVKVESKTRILRFNNAADQLRFRYYGSGQSAVHLYKKQITQVDATGINLAPTTLELQQYKSAKLTATLVPENATNKVTFISSDETVAVVDALGNVTALKEGAATITASVSETIKAECAVTVTAQQPITCATAREKALAVSGNNVIAEGGKYIIQGYVTEIKGDKDADFGTYGNYSFWMADTKDGGQVFMAYQVKPLEGTTLAKVGDFVEVIGDLTKYKDTPETTGRSASTVNILKTAVQVILTVNEEARGTVEGAGAYFKDETATIKANPTENYIFKRWSDGNTDNPRTLTIADADVELEAIFAKDIKALNGIHTIGGTLSDFESLYEAGMASATLPITGDVTFQITADLTEPSNIGLVNHSEFKMTLTVDKAEARTITFTQVADNAGPSGNLFIGGDMKVNAKLSHDCATELTKNITIDGSFNGDGEQHLTMITQVGVNKYTGPILIYGNVQDITVKNTAFYLYNTGSSNYAIVLRPQNNTEFAPSNILIDNNYIENLAHSASQGIHIRKGNAANPNMPSDVTISNNEFVCKTRGIFLQASSGLNITGNTFSIVQDGSGMNSFGIYGFEGTAGDILVEGNRFVELTTGAEAAGNGIIAIAVEGKGNWTIRNNFITGFNPLASTELMLKGIQVTGAEKAIIEHNTLVMPQLAQPLAATNPALLTLINATNATSVRNNLLVSYETATVNSLIANATAEVCANNIYYTDLTADNTYIGATPETKTLEGYQTIEPSAKVVAVEFVNQEEGDLSLTGESDGNANLGVPRIAEVAADIFGNPRAAKIVYAGAFEGKELNQDPTGLDNLSIDGVYFAQDIIFNTNGLMLHVYNVNGMLIASGNGNISMSGFAHGVYVVRSATGAFKLVK